MGQALWAFFIAAGVPLALRILAGVGVGFITYAGVGLGLDTLQTQITGISNQILPNVLSIMNLAGFQTALNAMLSSYAIAATLRGLTSGIFSRAVWHKPGA